MGYATGERALAECDRCGLTYRLRTLRKLTVNRQIVNLKVCDWCWEEDHPQLQTKTAVDNEALFEPRPDRRPSDLTNIRWGWNPVYALEATARIGQVSVA
jgi:hypothetical protein